MAEAVGTLDGWFALHDTYKVDWASFKQLPAAEQQAVLAEAAQFLSDAAAIKDAPAGASAFYNVLGHKGDLMFVHLRPTIDELSALERAFARTRFADYCSLAYSYLSVTELSLYEAQARAGDAVDNLMATPFVQGRLYPRIPDMQYICFYPMSKKRGEVNNWYAASMEDRRRLMREHGGTGRKYHEKVIQMITGSTGLDDWEWGVTLWSSDAVQFKKLVYEMRFDEVTAKYGEFGAFQVGVRFQPEGLAQVIQG